MKGYRKISSFSKFEYVLDEKPPDNMHLKLKKSHTNVSISESVSLQTIQSL